MRLVPLNYAFAGSKLRVYIYAKAECVLCCRDSSACRELFVHPFDYTPRAYLYYIYGLKPLHSDKRTAKSGHLLSISHLNRFLPF